MKAVVIIPAYNEEASIAQVVRAVPRETVERVIVVDNGSTDRTAEEAREAGACVVEEKVRGYGSSCRRGIAEAGDADILVFLDGDGSDDPRQLAGLVEPLTREGVDLVIGSRTRGKREPGALPPHAVWGNRLACGLIQMIFGVRFTDLGPFRAVRREALEALRMEDRGYGWTVEMQAKAAILGLRCREIPVDYRRRTGQSKISGTWTGSWRAGKAILWTIFRLWLRQGKIRRGVHG
ncbi:MAG: glycosyltransferase family 2 protein [bacterium]